MYSDRIYTPTSYTHRSASSTPRAIRKSAATPLTSASSSTSQFFKGRDGIFRPQSLYSLATESISSTSAVASPYSSSTYSSSLPKSTYVSPTNSRISDFRARHRTDSGYSSPKLSRVNYESSFQSNFSDNLRHMRSATGYSGYGTSSYQPNYRFTKAYYAPKMRERPLLSNLKQRFGSGRDLSSTPTSGSLRNKSSTSTAPSSHHGSTTSSRHHDSTSSLHHESPISSLHHDSVSSTGSNGNSVNSPANSVNMSAAPKLERNKFMIKFREHNQNQTVEKRRESIRWDIPRACRFSKSELKVGETIAEDEDDEPLELLKPTSPEPTETSEPRVDENNNSLSRWDTQFDLNTAGESLAPIEAKIEVLENPCEKCEVVDLLPVIKSHSVDLTPTKPKKVVKKIKKKRENSGDGESLNVSESTSGEATPVPVSPEVKSPTKITFPKAKAHLDVIEVKQPQQPQAEQIQREASPAKTLEVSIVLPKVNILDAQREQSPIETVNVTIAKPKIVEEESIKLDIAPAKTNKIKLKVLNTKAKSRDPSPAPKQVREPLSKTKSESKLPDKEDKKIGASKAVRKIKSAKAIKSETCAQQLNILTAEVSVVDTTKVKIGKAKLCKSNKKKLISKENKSDKKPVPNEKKSEEKKSNDEPKKLKKKKPSKELSIDKANECAVNDAAQRSPKSPRTPDNLPAPKLLKISSKIKKKVEKKDDEEEKKPTKKKTGEEKKVKAAPQPKVQSVPKHDSSVAVPANATAVTAQVAPTPVPAPKPAVTEPKRLRFREYCLEDFELVSVLGRGSFGKVVLAELKDYGVFFAIKALKKITVLDDDDIESIMIERKVLAYGSNYPFICKLFCTFQNETHLFFAMEWCGGGDMMFHVQKETRFSEEKTKFYACEILCCLNFLHSRGIIYRDLKLDNIMINKTGHISMVDFGMCVGKMYREDLLPSNFCGTPEYMAPEIIKGVKYNHSVDFWAFGIVIYEMLVGSAPFNGGDEDELLWNVCNRDVHYPNYLGAEVKDLIMLLLRRDPKQRLGMTTCREGKPQQQSWFADVDWNKVEQCTLTPPFIPNMSHAADISYFDRYFTGEKAVISSDDADDQPVSAEDQELFKGFNFTNHHMTD